MKAIGGYPELELRRGEHYHKNALRLNTARNCLEYILLARKYTKVYVPYYTCDAVYEPFKKSKSNCERVFYHINEDLQPIELPELKTGEAFLYTNYFGLMSKAVNRLAQIYGNRLIVDNSQAFYDMPCPGIDTFYSARKFFGVPDGAYLYTDAFVDDYNGFAMDTDKSFHRMDALLKRIDLSAEEGYSDFQDVEESLSWQPIMKMSRLTESILCSINYDEVRDIRRNNYRMLECGLATKQNLSLKLEDKLVPLCYPFFSESSGLRKILIDNKIFVPLYWPNVIKDSQVQSYENRLASCLLPLPVDQRCVNKDIERIIFIVSNYTAYT